MNAKKAKRLRQLVRHLMGQGAVNESSWISYIPSVMTVIDKNGTVRTISGPKDFVTMPIELDAGCGRAIYQKMKKNSKLSHQSHRNA